MVGSPNHLHLEHIRIGLERGLKIFTEKPVVTTVEETMELARADRRIRRRQCDGRPRPALRAALCRPAQGAGRRPARRRRLDRGLRAHPALSRRLLHARLAPLRALFRQLHAGEVLPRPRSLQRRHGLPAAIRVASFGGRRTFMPENAPQRRASTTWRSTTASRAAGWATDKVFDSDGDIIDFQTAIVEYANGAALTFHTNLNVPDDFRRFAVMGAKGMAEGDFVRNYLRVSPMRRTSDRLIDTAYKHRRASASITAPTSRWRDDIAHAHDRGRAAARLGDRCA